jgi:hypothetical protein
MARHRAGVIFDPTLGCLVPERHRPAVQMLTTSMIRDAADTLEAAGIKPDDDGRYTLVALAETVDPETRKAADELAAFCAPKGPKKKSSGMTEKAFLAALDEVEQMLAKGEWGQAEGKHFVALYAELHFKVYGVADEGLGPKERLYAATLARGMLEKDFKGDRREMALFVSWVWSREKGREKWRREQQVSRGRLTWRAVFGRAVLTDYRVEVARKKAGG